MTAPRYALAPGPVRSRSDGQVHHVSVYQLASLYCVPLQDCLVIPLEVCPQRDDALATARKLRLPILGPRYDGIYTLFPAIP